MTGHIHSIGLALLLALPGCGKAQAPVGPAPFAVERTIPLAGVAGRIDHLAVDVAHRRIFVAELGNGSVEAIDLDSGAAHRITGLQEPQGLAYLPERNELLVATGGDGSVHFFDAASLAAKGVLRLGDDADNLRVDPASGEVAVGYGGGAIAFIDPERRAVVRTIALPAHPEGFRLDGARRRLFVNLPNAQAIVAADSDTGKAGARWRTTHQLNFPMALDPGSGTIAIAYRWPARLVLLDAASGAVRQDLKTCGDADDLFFDARRRRIYVICGAGMVEAFELGAGGYAPLAGLATRSGARTGLFVAELDRLFVAERAGKAQNAALVVLRPQP